MSNPENTPVELSCGLPPGPEFSDLAALAEECGYARVWIFGSAPLWEDPFAHLALAASRTSRIGFGTAVSIPSERSEMAMASSIATVARLSGGRFRVCFGTGATARRTMGRAPLPLKAVGEYLSAVRGLLEGQTVTIDGSPVRMLHAEGLAAPRPVDAQIWLSAFGPRAIELAGRVADGIIGQHPHPTLPTATMRAGTVLEPGEHRESRRVREAVGPWRAVAYHEAYAIAGARAVDAMPGGAQWRAEVERLAPEDERHLLTHQGHVTHLTERDLPLTGFDGGFPSMIGEPDAIRAELTRLAGRGVREVIYTPSGPDVARELTTFAAAAR
ncbi:LLM class flavin-dependent oxidoreductase [Nocardia noduli]|uniref:LLM class flavin-dependent oxidoreductase n=1 Tax=Nocardia noduli TaxID=2815722 RepID=UPI001C21A360|nr:LLM class flavin-dependent oxidoreductase [Nocardia noduli]